MSTKKKSKGSKNSVIAPAKSNMLLTEIGLPSEPFLMFKPNRVPMFGIVLCPVTPYVDKIIGVKYDIVREERGSSYDIKYKVTNPDVGYFNANDLVISDMFNIIDLELCELDNNISKVPIVASIDWSCLLAEIRFKDFDMQEYDCNITMDLSALGQNVYIDVNESVDDLQFLGLDFSERESLYGLDTITVAF